MSEPSPKPPTSPPEPHDRHLWEFRWVRDLLWIAGFMALLWLMYMARSILVPVLVALALAYIFNPLITWIQRRWGWPRWAGVAAVLGVVLLILANIAVFAIPPMVSQTRQLVRNAPGYAREAAEHLDIDYDQWRGRASGLIQRFRHDAGDAAEAITTPVDDEGQPADDAEVAETEDASDAEPTLADIPWANIGQVLLRGVGVGYGVVSGVLGFLTYLLLFLFITVFCFFFFCWHFQGVIDWFKQFIPLSSYDRAIEIAGKMDRTLTGFIRGRLIQSLVLTSVLSIGWWMAGVPYWLLLGILCGFLNLIPYAAFVGWPLAIALTWADRAGGDGQISLLAIVVWPSVVYLVGQSLDGWVVEPLVQGKATALDPLSVLLAVMIGAALAGVLGMLLAIPVAACGKILAQEVIIPQLRNRARTGKT
jgi:predicted PurR-regulated permease PerM